MTNFLRKKRGHKCGERLLPGDDLFPLLEKAQDFGIILTQVQQYQFRLYLDELWQWNKKTNITGISTREGVVVELFLESIIPVGFFPEGAHVLDLGTGGGFPGLPAKICRPDLEVVLVESKRKKVNFLRHIIRLLALKGIIVVHGRLEENSDQIVPSGYQVVTARALASLEKTVELGAPYLSPDGLLVGFQGHHVDRAIGRCNRTMAQHGLVLHGKIPYTLPGTERRRHIVLFKRKGPGRRRKER
ncbi:MAG: 16S rRNA (guanine(527)-N(7))-methyltransferase RsmG [Deltaproteobacteria bacterium]|nr:16S rRNA (guanine(527)-N(7))-methyltransferase RsmG [Deltaproteobacteria bacterium]MBW2138807.1 16S rRNA (guanine(527)-N(7))-methyltransferase RsmG [Deltaproteobacteria bacterium]